MKTALLIIDMQNFFKDISDSPMPQIRMLNDFFRSTGRTVILTQHGHTEDELVPPIRNPLIRKDGPENVIMVGSKSWELLPEIWKMSEDAPIVGKNTYDAFAGSQLDEELRSQGVERVVVCGVMTDVCCETTARSAFCRFYDTWFVSDACASYTTEQHQRALQSVDFVLGHVYTAAETIAALRQEHL